MATHWSSCANKRSKASPRRCTAVSTCDPTLSNLCRTNGHHTAITFAAHATRSAQHSKQARTVRRKRLSDELDRHHPMHIAAHTPCQCRQLGEHGWDHTSPTAVLYLPQHLAELLPVFVSTIHRLQIHRHTPTQRPSSATHAHQTASPDTRQACTWMSVADFWRCTLAPMVVRFFS